MFIDRAKVEVRAGNGGNGMIAFHRENIFLEEVLRAVMVAVVVPSF